MKFDLEPGLYVVAVSGGIDSVALLHAMAPLAGLQLTVAHFDHGIRPDSAADAEFVRQLAAKYKLPFATERAELGAGASEAAARALRYDFLHRLRRQVGARSVVTAHHQDDLLETAVFNMLRGTNRRGLTSLANTALVKRPLLNTSKTTIYRYAAKHSLSWHEDSTNYDQTYARNYIRHSLLAGLDADTRQRLLDVIGQLQPLNQQIDQLLACKLDAIADDTLLDRQAFQTCEYPVAKELLALWLRRHQLADYDAKTLDRLTKGGRTKLPGKRLDVRRGWQIVVSRHQLALQHAEC